MDGLEINKVMMAVLLVGTGTLGGSILANELFRPKTPAKPGYEVAVAPPAGQQTAAAAAAPTKSMAEVFASANAANGPAVFRQCATCHTINKGGANGAGPNLWGVVGRNHAGAPGFNYSAAMKAKSGEPWTLQDVYAFITNPRAAIPGTSMAFAGIRSEQQRADLIAYLREQSDSPVEVPK
ncbi:c-type cytochrome [Phreatobacter cathodiphilus]|uniref:Cytochrome c family protein n=1 Tax=Phreatobacter cathodiphilus TaxID=1868589 RepID=A0A2S0NEQ9_9HYPH|nr:cytochrome c family protein [Phreatobacter cathodiphilus]AVO46526.1 cytochrome c family protein [Phreatobacter cathodiphilus]